MVCLKYLLTFFKGWVPKNLLSPLLNALSHLRVFSPCEYLWENMKIWYISEYPQNLWIPLLEITHPVVIFLHKNWIFPLRKCEIILMENFIFCTVSTEKLFLKILLMNFAKFTRTPILKSICKWLLQAMQRFPKRVLTPRSTSELYLEPSQISTMGIFCENC